MAIFPLLASPETYRACEADLLSDAAAREHWLEVYAAHSDVHLQAAADSGVAVEVREAARDAWLAVLADVRSNPGQFEQLDILVLDELRQRTLASHGIVDEYRLLKARENEAALAALPDRLATLDVLVDDTERLAELFRGLLAGNLFDMGVQATAANYIGATQPFARSLAAVPPRPWFVDDVERAAQILHSDPLSKVVIFVDNAGADVVLGVLPLVRELLRRSTSVILTANEGPAHNDITHRELQSLVAKAAEIDPAFASAQLQLICSGNSAPLIDLTRISDNLAAASADAELVVLVGMGRSIESNYSTTFTVPCWKIAMLKDEQVAKSVGGKLFDAVMGVDNAT